jgi:hypothetical protein
MPQSFAQDFHALRTNVTQAFGVSADGSVVVVAIILERPTAGQRRQAFTCYGHTFSPTIGCLIRGRALIPPAATISLSAGGIPAPKLLSRSDGLLAHRCRFSKYEPP